MRLAVTTRSSVTPRWTIVLSTISRRASVHGSETIAASATTFCSTGVGRLPTGSRDLHATVTATTRLSQRTMRRGYLVWQIAAMRLLQVVLVGVLAGPAWADT